MRCQGSRPYSSAQGSESQLDKLQACIRHSHKCNVFLGSWSPYEPKIINFWHSFTLDPGAHTHVLLMIRTRCKTKHVHKHLYVILRWFKSLVAVGMQRKCTVGQCVRIGGKTTHTHLRLLSFGWHFSLRQRGGGGGESNKAKPCAVLSPIYEHVKLAR